jgi:hypothetical protein
MKMSMREEIEWVEAWGRSPEEPDFADGEPEYVMTQDNKGCLRMYCYVMCGRWISEDKGYEEGIEEESCRVIAWAEWPEGPVGKAARLKR